MSKTILIYSEMWRDEGDWSIEEMRHIPKLVNKGSLLLIYNPMFDREIDFSNYIVREETETEVIYQSKDNADFHKKHFKNET